MDLNVCRDLVIAITRAKCTDPKCGCNPREVIAERMADINADPFKSFCTLLSNYNWGVAGKNISFGSFELGLVMGIALAASSSDRDLSESIRMAAHMNPELNDLLNQMKHQ